MKGRVVEPTLPRGLPNSAVQAWMQAAIVHPGGVEPALASPEAGRLVPPGQASKVIRARGGLTAVERLEIYAAQYPLRMAEALRSDYPALAGLLGARRFERLAADYIAANPSRSFTLARLGDRLPSFMAGWGSPRSRGLRTDVARLERAGTRVFDAEETSAAGLSALDFVAPPGWAGLRLRPAAAFELLAVRPGAVEALDALLEGAAVPRSAGRGKVRVAYYRQGFDVRRRTLDPFAGRLLEALVSGAPLGEAITRAAARCVERPTPGEVSGSLLEWFRLGIFAGVEAGPAAESPAA